MVHEDPLLNEGNTRRRQRSWRVIGGFMTAFMMVGCVIVFAQHQMTQRSDISLQASGFWSNVKRMFFPTEPAQAGDKKCTEGQICNGGTCVKTNMDNGDTYCVPDDATCSYKKAGLQGFMFNQKGGCPENYLLAAYKPCRCEPSKAAKIIHQNKRAHKKEDDMSMVSSEEANGNYFAPCTSSMDCIKGYMCCQGNMCCQDLRGTYDSESDDDSEEAIADKGGCPPFYIADKWGCSIR